MWSSRLFWKLFLTFAGLNLIAAAAFVVIVSGWQEEQVVNEVQRRLRDAAILLRSALVDDFPSSGDETIQTRIRRLGNETSTRITLVAMDGEVLADSEKASLAQVGMLDNHKGRLELVQAAIGGQGSSQRTSPTVGAPMLYFALRVDRDGEPIGLVRTAYHMADVQREVQAIRSLIWFVALAVSVTTLGLTYLVVARVIRPLSNLTEAAESIAAGQYQQRIYVSNRDELGLLAASFNRMSQQLATRVSQLRQTNERFATLLGSMVEGVIAVDADERILFANVTAGRLFGFSPAESEGRHLLETLRNHTLHEMVTSTISTRAAMKLETEIGESESSTIGVNSTPLPGDPCPGVVLVLRDVTELRRLESLRQEFVANVSHELKTPLSSIKAYSETLRNGAIEDPDNRLRFVARIEEQADRLHELILDMLSVARIESGQAAFDIVSIPLAGLVDSCMSNCLATAEAKGIALERTEGDESFRVQADEEGLRQILDNLLDNALKYTGEGGRISVNWRQEGDRAVIDIADTGIGIAAENLPRLFERFYRVDKARSRELGGTGLGLSIVKHLSQSFGGGVEVESEPGKGSVFSVRLPIAT